jgi:hypothetical protein
MSRTSKIVVFLIMLNASAGLFNATAFAQQAGVQVTIGGDQTINDAEEEARQVSTSRSAVDQFVGAIIGAAKSLLEVLKIIAIGPIMLSNLAAGVAEAGIIIGWLTAPLYFVVAFDLYEFLTGNQIS